MEKRFCDTILFDKKTLRKATEISWFQKFCLFFIEPIVQVDEVERTKLVYKIFRGKIYILSEEYLTVSGWNCRHKITSQP